MKRAFKDLKKSQPQTIDSLAKENRGGNNSNNDRSNMGSSGVGS